MADKLYEAFVELRADLDTLKRQLKAGVDETKKYERRVKASLARVRGAYVALGRGVTTAATSIIRSTLAISAPIIAVGAGVEALVHSTAKMGDQFAKASKKIGVATDILSALAFAAERSGSDYKSLETGLRQIARYAVEAADGSKEYLDVFNALGVELRDNEGRMRSIEELFLDTGEALRLLTSDTERVAYAQTLLGRAGSNLIPLFKEGKEGIIALMNEARQLGVVFTQAEGEMSEAFEDSLTNLKAAASGFKKDVVSQLLTPLTNINNMIADLKKEGQLDSWAKGVSDAILDVGEAFALLAVAINKVVLGWKMMANLGKQVTENISDTVGSGVGKVFEYLADITGTPFKVIKDGSKESQAEIERLKQELMELAAEYDRLILLQEKIKLTRKGLGVPPTPAPPAPAAPTQVREFGAALAPFPEEKRGIPLSLPALGGFGFGKQTEPLAGVGFGEGEGGPLAGIGAKLQTDIVPIFTDSLDMIKVQAEEKFQSDSGFAGVLGNTFSALITTTGEQSEVIKGLFANLMQSIVSNISKSLFSAIPGLGTFGGFFGFQHGGIAMKPIVASVAEKRPEAVIPLDRLDEFGGTTINFYGEVHTKSDKDTLPYEIERIMKRARMR